MYTASLCWLIAAAEPSGVRVDVIENFADKKEWTLGGSRATDRYAEPAFAFPAVPKVFTDTGVRGERSSPYVLRATAKFALPAGEVRLLIRSRVAARLLIDGREFLRTDFVKKGSDGHEPVKPLAVTASPLLPVPQIGDMERVKEWMSDGRPREFRFEIMAAANKGRPDFGEPFAAVSVDGRPFELLGPEPRLRLDPPSWADFLANGRDRHRRDDADRRARAAAKDDAYWATRHRLARELRPAPIGSIDELIGRKLADAGIEPPATVDDWAFLRRAFLDTVGVPPSPAEIDRYFRDPPESRRAAVVDRLLADDRWADHWVSYWQDVLGENPGLLKPTLNNTGPFRFYLHDALSDNWPIDRMVSGLVRMDGSRDFGGPAGFAVATENDVPMAAKATVLAKAFLAIDLQCCRCHDGPGRDAPRQQQLFGLAAMLERKPIKLPATSSVKVDGVARRPAVRVTLKPGTSVEPKWDAPGIPAVELPEGVVRNPADPRETFAALLTGPHNGRFAEVIVNRLWARWLGWALVDPIDDWSDAKSRHPELLNYLAGELIHHDYNWKAVARLILNSQVYQRGAVADSLLKQHADARLAGPARRRMTAEQVIDSAFAAAGKSFDCEELTLDPEGRFHHGQCANFGAPRRAWELSALSGERDRPSLTLPTAQPLVELMAAYGWRDTRPNSVTLRDDPPTPLQPLTLANGAVGRRVTTVSDGGALVKLARSAATVEELIDNLCRRILTRPPTDGERAVLAELLRDGFESRRIEADEVRRPPLPRRVTWSNHLREEANRLAIERGEAVAAGDPPTKRLADDWRRRYEDAVWALVNSPEFVFVP